MNEPNGNIYRCQIYHESNGLSKGWSRDRVDRVCGLLQLTVDELGALFAIPVSEMRKWHKQGWFPPYVALHFALIESWYLSERTQLPSQPLVPLHILK